MEKALDSGNVVAVAFVDFRKAFDSVSHEILEHEETEIYCWYYGGVARLD